MPAIDSPSTATVPSWVPLSWRSWVAQAAAGTGLPQSVVAAQINDESGFQANATSPSGAQGLAQFEPGTWASLGIAGSPYDPAAALDGYTKYMSELLAQFGGNVRDALAAYNAGPGNLAAGYGYADAILSKAGQPPGAIVGAPSSSSATSTGSSSSGSIASGVGGFLLRAVLTVALLGAGVWLAFTGGRGLLSYRGAPA